MKTEGKCSIYKKITHANFNAKNVWQEQLSYVTLKYKV